MKNAAPLVILLCGLSSDANAENVQLLRPVAATASSITDAKVKDWAQRATALLQHNDISGIDVPCDVTIRVQHNIIRDSSIKNLVQTQSEKQKLQAVTAGNIVIIDDLRWCGHLYQSTVAGCEGSGPIILVTQNSSAYQTIVHELGHRFGFSHTWRAPRCPVPPPAGAGVSQADFVNIMFCRGHARRLAVTTAQCDAFKANEVADLPEIASNEAPLPPVEEAVAAAPAQRPTDIVEFLTYGFDLGTPFDAIALLNEEDIAAIRAIVADPAKKELWSNAAIVLGLRGTAADVATLIALLKTTAAGSTPEDFRTRTSAAYGIGFLALKFPDAGEPGISLLLGGIELSEAAKLSETDPESLVRAFAQAIAYSGNVAATKAVIDAAAAGGKIGLNGNAAVEAYASAHSLSPDDQADLPELPVFDADFVQSLAETSVGMATKGLDYLENPLPDPQALSTMSTLFNQQTLDPSIGKAAINFGIEKLPEWNAKLPLQ